MLGYVEFKIVNSILTRFQDFTRGRMVEGENDQKSHFPDKNYFKDSKLLFERSKGIEILYRYILDQKYIKQTENSNRYLWFFWLKIFQKIWPTFWKSHRSKWSIFWRIYCRYGFMARTTWRNGNSIWFTISMVQLDITLWISNQIKTR